jgi:hypothetical protein
MYLDLPDIRYMRVGAKKRFEGMLRREKCSKKKIKFDV